MKIFIALFSMISCLALSLSAQAETYRPWQWMQSDCQNCGLSIVVSSAGSSNTKLKKEDNPLHLVEMNKIESIDVKRFVDTIAKYKSVIVELYGSDPQEYNLLAQMAFGILGNESEFFTSFKYFLKRNGSPVITKIKQIHELIDSDYETSPNSSGPTQIKVVPQKIAEKFNVTQETMRKWPAHAAVATMGYLIEALRELKLRAANNNLTFITAETYVDYLPYLYMGRAKLLLSGKAEPHRNLYVLRMKHYMKWIQTYEIEPEI